jgi:hypothetical protein
MRAPELAKPFDDQPDALPEHAPLRESGIIARPILRQAPAPEGTPTDDGDAPEASGDLSERPTSVCVLPEHFLRAIREEAAREAAARVQAKLDCIVDEVAAAAADDTLPLTASPSSTAAAAPPPSTASPRAPLAALAQLQALELPMIALTPPRRLPAVPLRAALAVLATFFAVLALSAITTWEILARVDP